MLTLPAEYVTLIQAFAPIFSKRIWQHIQILVIGAILAPGNRTVTVVLRIMGLSQEKHLQNYHRVLNRAIWSSLEISHRLLTMLITTNAAIICRIGLSQSQTKLGGRQPRCRQIDAQRGWATTPSAGTRLWERPVCRKRRLVNHSARVV